MRRFIAFTLLVIMMASCAVCVANGEERDIIRSAIDECDMQEAKKKGLVEEKLTEKYYELREYYAKAIWELLRSKCDILKIDDMLGEHELHFLPAETPVNEYQRIRSFGAKYFFLRNIIYIERLTKDEIATLEELMQEDPDTERAQEFVMQTLPRIISPYVGKKYKDVSFAYEPDGRSARNGSIVLGLATGMEFRDGESVDAYEKREGAKARWLLDFAKEISQQMTEEMGYEVTVILY